MMSRTKSLRVIGFTVFISLALGSLQGGCEPSVGQRVIASAMLGDTADAQRVIRAGEKAIPGIFHEMRLHPDAQHWLGGMRLVQGMVDGGTAESSAPTVRQVLRDTTDSTDVRCLAASMSILYWSSDDVLGIVIDCASKDRSVRVRVCCTKSTGTIASIRANRRKKWSIDERLVDFFIFRARDKHSLVRQATIEAVGSIANSALVEADLRLPWAWSLLRGARKDPTFSVRKAAVSALMRLEQTKRKPLHKR